MEKKLYRDEHQKVIGGVCAGLADYFGVDIAIIRAIFLLALILKGGGLLIYIVLWIVLPKKGFYNPGVDYRVPPQGAYDPFGGIPPQPGAPFDNPFVDPPKKTGSTVGLIFGAALIFIGLSCLLNEFDILPNLNFARLWPVLLVGAGAALILSGKKKPWEKDNWQHTDATANKTNADDAGTKDDEFKNTPPTV